MEALTEREGVADTLLPTEALGEELVLAELPWDRDWVTEEETETEAEDVGVTEAGGELDGDELALLPGERVGVTDSPVIEAHVPTQDLIWLLR